MTSQLASRTAAFMGLAAVALGAFGAHGLKEVLNRNDTAATWETAVLYHFFHTLMLFILARSQPLARGPWCSFLAGVLIFSGSLYLLSVTNLKWLGAVTPIGGLCFIIGWFWLVFAPPQAR